MDGSCKAWKLRNSTEIWRPKKHASNKTNNSASRGELTTSDSNHYLSAMMRDKEKTLQGKSYPSIFFSQDRSGLGVGNKSPSPILRCRTTSPDLCRSLSAEHAAQKRANNRPASVSPHMWQEKMPIPKNKIGRSRVACKRWQSPQRATTFGAQTSKAKVGEVKKKCFSRSVDISFVPGDPQLSSSSVQKRILEKRVPYFLTDQKMVPLPQNLEELSDELVFCSLEIFPNMASCTKKTSPSPCVDSQPHPEQCIVMRNNTAFEPWVKPSKPHKSHYLPENKKEVWNGSTVLQQPKKEVVKEATQFSGLEASISPLEPKDGVWAKRNYDLEATLSCSDPSETLKEESIEFELEADEVKCKASKDPASLYEATDGTFEVVEYQVSSPHKRRWPRVLLSTSNKDSTESYSTISITSSSDSLSEENTSKQEIQEDHNLKHMKIIKCHKNAVNKTHKFHMEDPHEDSSKVVECSPSDASHNVYLGEVLAQDTEEGKYELLQGLPKATINSKIEISHNKNKKPTEKAVLQDSNKWNEEVLPAFVSTTNSEPKAGVFSLKSKRSLERAALDIIEKKRRDESSQQSGAAEDELRKTNIHNKILTKAKGTSTIDMKNRELQQKKRSNSNPQKSMKMNMMSISGPANTFQEVTIDLSVRASQLSSTEEKACDLDKSYNSDQNLELTNILQPTNEQTDSTCEILVLGVLGQETDSSNLQNIVTASTYIEKSYHEVNNLERLQDQATNSSLYKICNNTQHEDSLEVIPWKATLNSNNISRKLNSSLHKRTRLVDHPSLSSEKFSNILSYLEHVEETNMQDNFNLLQKVDVQERTSCDLKGSHLPYTILEQEDCVSMANSISATSLSNIPSSKSGDREVSVSPTASLFEGVRKKMQDLKSTIAAKETQNAKLLEDMEKLKADKEQALSLAQERFGQELEVCAREYKRTILHHLTLNEKMVTDKEALSEKCCNLAGSLSAIESKYEDKMKALKEQFVQELKKQKEMWIAGEKPRREVWKEKKIKEIKELTIKGLEPHIDGLNEKHKQGIKKVETRYAHETQKKLEVQSLQHRQEMCELRNCFLKERDEIMEKERLAALTRMNDVAEKYEHQAMEFRRKVSTDMAMELEKVEEGRRKDKQLFHETLSKVQEECNHRETAVKNNLEKGTQNAIAEKDTHIRSLQLENEKFKKDWQENFNEKLLQSIKVQEDQLRSRCTKERDEQIEMIIERMENEKDEAIAQHQQELLTKVESLMEEKLNLMKKLKEVESKCASLCNISIEAKQKAEMETANKDMQVESFQREVICQADLIEQLKAQIQQEKKQLKEQEQQHELQLAKEHDKVEAMHLEVEKCTGQTQQLRLRKAKELEEVEIHVRQAIENKDQIIAGLREQLLAAQDQNRHIELLLQPEHTAFLADPD